ncbi:cysteine-rich CWC family protein [Thioalkalicoccus limnaeus]|uniref:Cysteine-rich CWC family protein n=1 Tax=Thioalkalicoccus limnaeus TaxID=120681 RepID=A0ABV4BJE3_9GAMM
MMPDAWIPKHETKQCPRCGRLFVCMANRVMHCECMTVSLSERVADLIAHQYDDCLCLFCLRALQQEDAKDRR